MLDVIELYLFLKNLSLRFGVLIVVFKNIFLIFRVVESLSILISI